MCNFWPSGLPISAWVLNGLRGHTATRNPRFNGQIQGHRPTGPADCLCHGHLGMWYPAPSVHWLTEQDEVQVVGAGLPRCWGRVSASQPGTEAAQKPRSVRASLLLGFPGSSDGKAFAYNAGDLGTWVWSLGQEDPLKEGIATHSSIHAWKIPWTKELSGLQSMGLQRVDTTEWLHFTSLFNIVSLHA